MKFETPQNPNYTATVVTISNIIPLENCDNVVATTIFGFQGIVGKDTKIGDVGIMFPAETQLSEDFCIQNNLFRHNEKNKDPNAKGYIEDNRRIKAVKFRGHASSCLFLPLSSLAYLGLDPAKLEEGDTFDAYKGIEVCKKYERKVWLPRGNHQAQPKRFNRVDTRFIPEHLDTENYFRNDRNVKPEWDIIVTQKLHGTSIRVGNTIVARKLTLLERVAKFFGAKVQESEIDYVYASRKAIKDVNNPYANHFYETDIWSEEGAKLKGLIPENYILYGELIGFTSDGAAIQADYTYDLPEKTCALYIYRVAHVNAQGFVSDLSWDQVKEFCVTRNLKHVPEMWRGKHADFKVNDYMEKRYSEAYASCVPLSNPKLVDEGVCIRVDRMTPYILKAKSPSFLEHETKMLDAEAKDLEAEGSVGPNTTVYATLSYTGGTNEIDAT